MLESYFCAACRNPVIDLEAAYIRDPDGKKTYTVCFDCADKYSDAELIRMIKRSGKPARKNRKNE